MHEAPIFSFWFYVGLLAATLIGHWVFVRVRAIIRLRRAEKLVRREPKR